MIEKKYMIDLKHTQPQLTISVTGHRQGTVLEADP